MRPLGETRRHFWLVQRMAGKNGIDLARAGAKGDLDQETWAKVVHRCRGCSWVEGCERLLKKGETDLSGPMAEWPDQCLNRMSLAGLKVLEEMDDGHESQ